MREGKTEQITGKRAKPAKTNQVIPWGSKIQRAFRVFLECKQKLLLGVCQKDECRNFVHGQFCISFLTIKIKSCPYRGQIALFFKHC